MVKIGYLMMFVVLLFSCKKRELQGKHNDFAIEKRTPQHLDEVKVKKEVTETSIATTKNQNGLHEPKGDVNSSPDTLTVHQKDGTILDVIGKGNRTVSYAETVDGYTVLRNKEKIYEYAIMADQGNLIVSGTKARNPGHRSKYEKKFLEGHKTHLRYTGVTLQKLIDKKK